MFKKLLGGIFSEEPNKVEILSYLRGRLLPLGFTEEEESGFTRIFRREKFTVRFGYDPREPDPSKCEFFFQTGQGKAKLSKFTSYDGSVRKTEDMVVPVYDVELVEPGTRIEGFKKEVHVQLEKWLKEIGLGGL